MSKPQSSKRWRARARESRPVRGLDREQTANLRGAHLDHNAALAEVTETGCPTPAKRRFDSEAQVISACKYNINHVARIDRRPYVCPSPDCGGWHLSTITAPRDGYRT